MRLGIDFGTTRTVVAAADRGNYPVVSFQADTGDTLQWFPSLVASQGRECLFGLEAQARLQDPGWHFLRSLKRVLGDAGPNSLVSVGHFSVPVLSLLTDGAAALRRALHERCNLEISHDEPLEALIAVPANSNSNQRYMTLEAFRRAGFAVLGMINEPSAAGIEYAHRYRRSAGSAGQEHLIVYDLGGGTFDISLVRMQDRSHEVLTNEGIAQLGGDDFDELLLELALSRSGSPSLSAQERFLLLEECREQKEGLHPNTRKIAVDIGRALDGAPEAVVTTAAFYDRCRPLVERTMAAVESAIARAAVELQISWNDMAAIYLAGGSSDLPIVSRMMRERYGRRVRRSPYPFAATAIGLAIAADKESGYALRERFTRHFGVWREAESGRRITFDPIFVKDVPLPCPGEPPLLFSRIYRPAHNVGHFRYLECSGMSADGQPCGDITPWDEIYFPFDAALHNRKRLDTVEVRRADFIGQDLVEEQYACHSTGVIEVTIAKQGSGFRKKYRLRR